jgi:hypothetical protein
MRDETWMSMEASVDDHLGGPDEPGNLCGP